MELINGLDRLTFRELDRSGVELIRVAVVISLSGPPGIRCASSGGNPGSASGPVLRMKSTKSVVVSVFGLASRGMIGLERPIDDVDDVCN